MVDGLETKQKNTVGNYYFGDNISLDFQKNIETKFFNHFLKGNGSKKLWFTRSLCF